MAEHQFGSILDRDFRTQLQKMADEVNVHGKTIQDLVAEGQLTEEQYAELIKVINGMLESGHVKKSDLAKSLIDEINKKRDEGESIELDDLSQEIIDLLNGATGTFELLSIPRDGSVSAEKTNFFNITNNLLNPDTVTSETSVDADGTIITDESRWLSDYIHVSALENISFSEGSYRIPYYDEEKNFITRAGFISDEATHTYQINNYSNVAYIRVSGTNTTPPEDTMINRGVELLPYEPFENLIKGEVIPETPIEKIPDIPNEKLNLLVKSHNLFDKSTVLIGKSLDPLTGEEIDDPNSAASEFIPINGGSTYSFENTDRFFIYKEDRSLSKSLAEDTVETFTVHSFVRVTMSIDNIDRVQVYEGAEKKPYKPYGLFVDENYLSVSSGTQMSDERIVMTGDTPVDVENYRYAEIDANIGRGSYTIHASKDGGATFENIAVEKLDSGNLYHRVSVRGVYAADVSSFTHLKYVRDHISNNPEEFNLYLSTENKENPVDTTPNKYWAPATPSINYELIDIGSKEITDLSKDGTVYAMDGAIGYKSTDYGATWQELGSPSEAMGVLRKLDNGALFTIVRTSGGMTEYWITDTNEQNWTMTYSHTTQGQQGASYGLDIYQNIILHSPYQAVKTADLIQLHYSKDYGQTWKPIFDSPLIEQWHMHDTAYDPYQDRIYMVSGDNLANANTYWTDNEGDTWHQSDPDGEGRSQFTSINPIPGYVLFGTDESRVRGVFRHPRNQTGTDNFVMDPAFHDIPPGSQEKNIVIGGFAQYWDTNNAAFFLGNDPVNLYATRDGFNYYTVLNLSEGRISNLTRVDNNDKMAMNYRVGTTNHIMLIDKLDWVEI